MNVDMQIEKNVFLVFYAGERAKAKILKICEAFGANRYPFAEESGKQAQMIAEVCSLFLLCNLRETGKASAESLHFIKKKIVIKISIVLYSFLAAYVDF